MTIDEAIEQQKSIAKRNIYRSKESPNEAATFKALAENHEQLAEWLEELKVYHQHEVICNNGYNAGYNKGIDDFVKFASDMPTVEEEDGTIRPMWLEEIAEQLKVGGENE